MLVFASVYSLYTAAIFRVDIITGFSRSVLDLLAYFLFQFRLEF